MHAMPAADDRPRLAALSTLPARQPITAPVPPDLPAPLPERLALQGVRQLWCHQAEALAHVRAGRHVVVATGTASGKSLCYQLPLLERLLRDGKATALYLGPTKALAHDQLRALRDFRLPHVRAATYDGDTPRGERDAVRRTANVVLTNPDMLHVGILPAHRRWGDFLHRLALVVVDECHIARGVFGSHVAAILRRLRRVCGRYGAAPTFVLASATIGNPGEHASALTGLDVTEVLRDGSPRPPVAFALWEPPLTDPHSGARRSTLAEAGDLLAGLVAAGPATLAFVKSRKGAELVARQAQRQLRPLDLAGVVRAYRAGHLPGERRAVETGLLDGSLRGVATTDALELGVDVGSLDAVVIAGWPGTMASLWQQAGRAGRRDQAAIVTFVAGDDPLDHYLLAHPDELLGRPLESAVIDLTNPYVLRPHLGCAAFELPLERDEPWFHPGDIAGLAAEELQEGRLRERAGRLYWAGRGSPAGEVGIRSAGGPPFRIVDGDTGALVGDVDEARAHRAVHAGAIYLHQDTTYRVEHLDLSRRVALVRPDTGDTFTRPRTDTDIRVAEVQAQQAWGRCGWQRGRVEVSHQVVGYERRRLATDELLALVELDLPPQHLRTQALWLTVPPAVVDAGGIVPVQVPGAAHAAEHAMIGMLPLFAMCDRWDVGGVSTARHPDTGMTTIFIYDGHPGGAGITERAWRVGSDHVDATRAAVRRCPCERGCPSCVHSPKCGNGNEPLDKAGAVTLLEAVLGEHADGRAVARARRRLA